MAGKQKYAERMGSHLGESIEAACPITRTGGTATQIGGTIGGAVGALASTGKPSGTSDITIGQFAWLGVGPAHFAITQASAMGRPKGEPLVRAAYAEVAEAVVTEQKLTLRVDLALRDGRLVAFEAKRMGANKPNVEVIELFRQRCAPA